MFNPSIPYIDLKARARVLADTTKVNPQELRRVAQALAEVADDLDYAAEKAADDAFIRANHSWTAPQ